MHIKQLVSWYSILFSQLQRKHYTALNEQYNYVSYQIIYCTFTRWLCSTPRSHDNCSSVNVLASPSALSDTHVRQEILRLVTCLDHAILSDRRTSVLLSDSEDLVP